MGLRARTFDTLAREVAGSMDRCLSIPTRFEPSPEKFSPDGYHPSAAGCQVRAQELSPIVADPLSRQ
jgi:hypothetical protein